MRIVLLGKNGQVGWELRPMLERMGEVVALGRGELDLADGDAVRRVVREVRPELIVNAAAFTGVDQAESQPELAMAVNGAAPGILAEEAERLRAGLVHYSTDYVFDGTTKEPYTEADEARPLNVYGRTKLEGERAVAAVGGAYLVLRTGWVYGLRRRSFLTAIREQAARGAAIRVVDDQVGSPTWCRSVAEATAGILTSLAGGGGFRERLMEKRGTYHYSAAGATSWFGFARRIVETDPSAAKGVMPVVEPISSAETARPARRPAYSVLSTGKVSSEFDIKFHPWEHDLGRCWSDQGKHSSSRLGAERKDERKDD